MRPARDTFLHFLRDNLPSTLTVKNIRRDNTFPSSSQLQMNAVNVQFLSDSPRIIDSDLLVSVDLIFDDELAAIEAAATVYSLLSQSGYTPLMNYSVSSQDYFGSVPFGIDSFGGSTPVYLGSNLMWNPNLIKFREVYGQTYYRYSASLNLSYHFYDPGTLV